MAGYEVSQLSSSPYDRGTLVAAVAPTSGIESSLTNKLIFYQVQERAAGTILDPLLDSIHPDGQEDNEGQAAAAHEEDGQEAGTI